MAILNGFGRSLGDGVVGIQALTVAIQERAVTEFPVLFRLPGLSPILEELYAAASDIAQVAELPWPDAERGDRPEVARGFATVIDLRDFAFDPAFRKVAMIDYFLRHLGVDPDAVPARKKRNSWLAARVRHEQAESGYVLVWPRASMGIRCMPPAVHDRILDWLTRNQERPALTQAALPAETTLSGLCALVAGAALVISTDTAAVHLADAFSRPCLAFFTTHRPEWRVRDYPGCRSVYLPSGLPDALEFARDAEDVAIAQSAWWRGGDDLGWLDRTLAATLGDLEASSPWVGGSER